MKALEITDPILIQCIADMMPLLVAICSNKGHGKEIVVKLMHTEHEDQCGIDIDIAINGDRTWLQEALQENAVAPPPGVALHSGTMEDITELIRDKETTKH